MNGMQAEEMCFFCAPLSMLRCRLILSYQPFVRMRWPTFIPDAVQQGLHTSKPITTLLCMRHPPVLSGQGIWSGRLITSFHSRLVLLTSSSLSPQRTHCLQAT